MPRCIPSSWSLPSWPSRPTSQSHLRLPLQLLGPYHNSSLPICFTVYGVFVSISPTPSSTFDFRRSHNMASGMFDALKVLKGSQTYLFNENEYILSKKAKLAPSKMPVNQQTAQSTLPCISVPLAPGATSVLLHQPFPALLDPGWSMVLASQA